MNPKKVASVTLLAFVAVSALYLVTGDTRRPSAGAPEGAGTDSAEARVVAYYFHGTARCRTCLSIENTAREVLQSAYADDLESGALRWLTVDFELPENEHFAEEFQLTGASLVLVREAGGGIQRWDNLERVWELIGDEARFTAYVTDQAREYLNPS